MKHCVPYETDSSVGFPRTGEQGRCPAAMVPERSDAILRAAERVLANDGDATMVDVAQAAGVGRTTLYRYFTGMDELRARLVHVAATDATRRLRSAGLHRVGFEEGLS